MSDLFKSIEALTLWNQVPAEYLEKSVLTEKQRENTDKMHYLLPEKGMFPTPDAKHAHMAYDMADRALSAGHITAEEATHVKKAAKERLKALGDPMGEAD